MQSFRLALASLLVSASACSFLLDTDKLQKSGAAGSGGTGGNTMVGDSGPEAGAGCTTDIDCQPANVVDGCQLYKCGADKTCLTPQPYSGLGVVSIPGDAEVVQQADDIGYPSLLADQTDILLGFWTRNETTTNIVLRRYDERPEISPVSADLSAIYSGRFDAVASSPGMAIRTLPRRVRLLAAGRPMGVATTGMYQIDVDLASLRLSAMQPAKTDLGVTGYDTSPRGPAPRFVTGGVQEPGAMWIQQGKLFYSDNISTGEVYGSKRVIGFAPVGATSGLHAALETTELGSTDDSGQTEIWTRGSNLLTALIGDQPGTKRRGVTVVSTSEAPPPLNFVLWSFEKAGIASLLYAGATCDTNSCTGFGAPMLNDATYPATNPQSASARVTGSPGDRDMAITFQITAVDPDKAPNVRTALIAGVSRLTTSQDAGGGISSKALNPASFLVALNPGVAAVSGTSSVAVTGGGLVMVAWVERGGAKATLKTRRFQVKSCP